jgi:hypothetical protein
VRGRKGLRQRENQHQHPPSLKHEIDCHNLPIQLIFAEATRTYPFPTWKRIRFFRSAFNFQLSIEDPDPAETVNLLSAVPRVTDPHK